MAFKKNSIPWNKGLTKETNKTVKIIAEKKIGRLRLDMIGNRWGINNGYKKGHKLNVGKHWKIKNTSNMGKGPIGKKPWNYEDGRSKNPIKREKIKGILITHINWCKANQIHRVPNGCMIHHIDQNPMNNNPENLKLMTKDFHSKLHNEFNKFKRGYPINI